MRPNSRARTAAVGLDLRAQRVDIGKRPLVAQPLDERQPQLRVVQIAVDVEECVSIDLPIDVAERRPHADVGDRRMDDAVDGDERGIDAGRRHQLVVGAEVRGRKPELAAAAGAARDRCRR